MKNGFTLAELLITVCIIGVIIALIAPTLIAKNSNTHNKVKHNQKYELIKYDYNFT